MEPNMSLQEAFLEFLLDQDIISEGDVVAALDRRREMTPPVGEIAQKKQILSVKQVNRILVAQCDSDLRFGELAVELGYLQPAQVQVLLQMQVDMRPSPIEALQQLGLLDTKQLLALREEFLQEAVCTIQ